MKYETSEPLAAVVDFLEKTNNDKLASEVIDAYAARSSSIEQINLLAKLYMDIRNIAKAEEFSLKVLGLARSPDEIYSARANLGKLYNHINEPEKSLFQIKLNRIVRPNDPDVLLEMVFSLYLLGRKQEAEDILRELKANEENLADHHRDIVDFNLGTYDLEHGKFTQGLQGFMLAGRRLKIWLDDVKLPFKFWDGGIFPGKTLILYADGGGIGDEMLLIRFMDTLKDAGFEPVYYTSRRDLAQIFNRCGYRTVTSLEGLPADSLWTYYMQVPIYLRSTPESVINSKYLFPSADAKYKWQGVKENKKLKIGVRWQGNAKNERDLHRKVPLDGVMAALHSVFDPAEVDYYSLQLGDGEEDIVNYPELIDVTSKIHSYDDTLALLENLDLVVTSCTSVLHASAIVGTKTLGLIPISAYFTWVSPVSEDRDPRSSIWYPDNLLLFKQDTTKNWDTPLANLTLELQNFAATHEETNPSR